MTTTAEKIKVMQAFEDGQKIEFIWHRRKDDTRPETRGWVEWGETWEEPLWDWDLCDYRIKPPDPEPLECWVNDYAESIPDYYATESLARQNVRPLVWRTAVPMREVTPQDEQDRKDAARYRYLKTKTSGVIHLTLGESGWLDRQSTEEWDEIIDKAMETGN